MLHIGGASQRFTPLFVSKILSVCNKWGSTITSEVRLAQMVTEGLDIYNWQRVNSNVSRITTVHKPVVSVVDAIRASQQTSSSVARPVAKVGRLVVCRVVWRLSIALLLLLLEQA